MASRYSLTQRSMTAADFSTLSNWPTTWPTGLNAPSTVWSGQRCVPAAGKQRAHRRGRHARLITQHQHEHVARDDRKGRGDRG